MTTTQNISGLILLSDQVHAAMEAHWATADRLWAEGRETHADWAQAQGEIFQTQLITLNNQIQSMRAARRILRGRL